MEISEIQDLHTLQRLLSQSIEIKIGNVIKQLTIVSLHLTVISIRALFIAVKLSKLNKKIETKKSNG